MDTADWIPSGTNKYYRKFELGLMKWKDIPSFSHYYIACSLNGGPLAFLLKDNGEKQKCMIMILSAFGSKLGMINILDTRIVFISWTIAYPDNLLLLQDDGTVLIYNQFGNFIKNDKLSIQENWTILDSHIFLREEKEKNTGLAVLSRLLHQNVPQYKLFYIENVMNKNCKITEFKTNFESFKCVNTHFNTQHIQSFQAYRPLWHLIYQYNRIYLMSINLKNKKFFITDKNNYELTLNLDLKGNQIQFSIHSNNRHIAIYDKYSIHVVNILWDADISNLNCRLLYSFCIESDPFIKIKNEYGNVYWCGSDTLLCIGSVNYVLYSLDEGSTQVNKLLFTLNNTEDAGSKENDIIVIPEIDGCRLITKCTTLFVQKVPTLTTNIFKISSTSYTSFLYNNFCGESSSKFMTQMFNLHRFRTEDRKNLKHAIMECINGAFEEYCVLRQKKLLTAASCGLKLLAFTEKSTKNMVGYFYRALGILKLLNNLRCFADIPLTYTQFIMLCYSDTETNIYSLKDIDSSIKIVINKLTDKKFYALALEITKNLLNDSRSKDQILCKWACSMARSSVKDLNLTESSSKLPDQVKASQSLDDIEQRKLGEILTICDNDYRMKLYILIQLHNFREALNLILPNKDNNIPIPYKLVDVEWTYYILIDALQVNQDRKFYNYIVNNSCTYNNLKNINRYIPLSLYGGSNDTTKTLSRKDIYIKFFKNLSNTDSTKYNKMNDVPKDSLFEEIRQLSKHFEKLKLGPKTSVNTLLKYCIKNELNVNEIRTMYQIPAKRFMYNQIQSLAEQKKWKEIQTLQKTFKNPSEIVTLLQNVLKNEM